MSERPPPPDEDPEERYWIHTHGLEMMGGFNFDLVDIPGNAGILEQLSFFDCVAAKILSGDLAPEEKNHEIAGPGLFISLVPAHTFAKGIGIRQAQKLLPDSEDAFHADHAILCEPRGFFRRKIKPCGWLQKEDLEGMLIHFTDEATDLMSRRARSSLPLLRKYFAFALENKLPVLVKLAYETSSGSHEHLWFTVHEIGEDYFDATLGNQPYDIEGMNRGDRGKHPFSRLTDWMILTPLGMTNPESTMSIRSMKTLIELQEQEKISDA